MISIRNIIFSLFGGYEKRADINKDPQGKGTLERFNEVVGKDIDEELLAPSDSLVSNNIPSETVLFKYLSYRENQLGIDLVIYPTEEWRRIVLKYYAEWVRVKGTARLFELLFSLVGITATVTEYFVVAYGFDSFTTFDDEKRRFDSNTCNECVEYLLVLRGSLPLTFDLKAMINRIVIWNSPINTQLRVAIYNGQPIT